MSKWKDVVRTVAPVLGTALGGPMAGTAIKFIAESFLGKPDATEEELEQAIVNASPADLEKLKSIDAQFKVDMKKLDIDLYALQYKEMESARGLFKVNVWPQMLLSFVFILVYFFILYMLLIGSAGAEHSKLDPAMQGVTTTIIGVLTAAIPQILNFWFGSSLGSKEKTGELGKASSKKAE